MWRDEERATPIATQEALALLKTSHIATESVSNARIDCYVDNQVLVNCWDGGGSKAPELMEVLKELFNITLIANCSLHLNYITSSANPTDYGSRWLSDVDCTLSPHAWQLVEEAFGPYSIDLMAIPANVQRNSARRPLKFIAPFPLHEALGTNVFSQALSPEDNAYVFPLFVLVGPPRCYWPN